MLNVIIALPGDTPLTMPLEDPITAIAGLLLDQLPVPVALVITVVVPMHIWLAPTIGAIGFTEINWLALAVLPHRSVTVTI